MGVSQSKHIILVSYYWPPAGGSGVQRWWFFTNELAKKGWTIDVITVQHPAGAPIDSSFIDQAHPNINIYPLSIWEPGKRLYSTTKSKTSKGLFSYVVRWIRANFFFPDARQFFIKPAIRLVKKRLAAQPIQWLITTGPPHSIHMVGHAIRKSNVVQWLADFRDPWTQFYVNHELPMMSFVRKKHKRIEQQVISTADHVLTTTPSLARFYSAINPSVSCIYNGYERILEGTLSDEFSITYTGVLKPNQHIETLWAVFDQLSSRDQAFANHAHLHLYGVYENKPIPPEMENQVTVHGYHAKEVIDSILPQSHLLLLLGNDHPQSQFVIHGKLYAYMAARRPILAIVNKHGDMSKIIKDYQLGAAFLYTEIDQITAWIATVFEDYKSKMSAPLQQPDQRFLRKKQAEQLHLYLNQSNN